VKKVYSRKSRVTKIAEPAVFPSGRLIPTTFRIEELILATNPAATVLRFSLGRSAGERSFIDAFEHAPNGMAILDNQGRITHASIALRNLLGYTHIPLVGMELSEITHTDDVETEREQRKRLASGEIDRYQLVQRLICEDGATIWVQICVSACRGMSGVPTQFVLQAEKSSGRLPIGLDASPDALEHLLGDVVHEIGNTLTPLMVNTQIIVERSTTSEISDAAHVIFNATRRIAFTLRRMRGLKDLRQSVAYIGEGRMLDLRSVSPPEKAD
jgi:PAS domain S-box-containing protein